MSTGNSSPLDWSSLRRNAIASVHEQNLPKSIELPALPHAITEFIEKSSNPHCSLGDLAKIIEKDSSLTVELLKSVNSAVFALSNPARSILDALRIMGINSAKTHLLATGVKAASRALKSKLINQRNFWNESLQRALFAREVARRLKLDTGLAFLGGLLQDYLLPVLTNHFDKLYIKYLEGDAIDGRDLADWERETFGWDHASAGAWYAAKWNFPDDLLCAIFFHHSLQATLESPEPEFFKLFPVALPSMLPDQMRQKRDGFHELIRVDKNCRSLSLDEVCQTVDAEQMQMAEGYEIPNHLTRVLAETRRIVNQVDLVPVGAN